MDKETKVKLAEIIVETLGGIPADVDGWKQMATLGSRLRMMGVDFRQYGYAKLRPFIESFDNILELRQVESAHDDKIKVCYVRLRRQDSSEAGQNASMAVDARDDDQSAYCAEPSEHRKSSGSVKRNGTEKDGVFTPERRPYDGELLIGGWAYVHPNSIEALARMALPERWHYGDNPQPGHEYDLLRNYLGYTFIRICYEGKLLFSECEDEKTHKKCQCAAFHTGLADKKYEPIYAMLTPNVGYGPDKHSQPWYLKSFVTASEGHWGKQLYESFSSLPQRADYFNGDLRNAVYSNITKDNLKLDYKHIYVSRLERFPCDFLEINAADEIKQLGVDLDDIYNLPPTDRRRKDYFYKLGLLINNNASTNRKFKNRLDDAIDLALRRMEWNYKTAIPVYYAPENNTAILLPLALLDDDKVDLALVVSRVAGEKYQGETILTLDMAYKNSRLITRPDSDWLNLDNIGSPSYYVNGEIDNGDGNDVVDGVGDTADMTGDW